MNGLGIDNVDQIAINMKPKRPSPPHSVHRKVKASIYHVDDTCIHIEMSI